MTTENRYFRSDTHTVNGLLARKLLTAQSGSSASVGSTSLDGTFSIGIRVFKRDSGGVETEITLGSPVAVADYVSDGIHSAVWSCPRTGLESTDAIVVRVYILTVSWVLKSTWSTEQLGAAQLDAATWTVYYYLVQSYDEPRSRYMDYFFFDSSVYDSRIEGFGWSVGLPSVVGGFLGDGLAWVQG